MGGQTPGLAALDPQMHQHEVIVKRARIILPGKADDRMRHCGIAVHGGEGLFIGHCVVALFTALKPFEILFTRLDIARGVGVDQIGSKYLGQSGDVPLDDRLGPVGLCGLDGFFGRRRRQCQSR